MLKTKNYRVGERAIFFLFFQRVWIWSSSYTRENTQDCSSEIKAKCLNQNLSSWIASPGYLQTTWPGNGIHTLKIIRSGWYPQERLFLPTEMTMRLHEQWSQYGFRSTKHSRLWAVSSLSSTPRGSCRLFHKMIIYIYTVLISQTPRTSF